MNRDFNRKFVAALFAPLLALSIGTAFAQGTTPPAGGSPAGAPSATGGATGADMGTWDAQTFSRLDKNSDGMLSREEAQADPTVSGAWSKLDAGNKGTISKEDFERYGKTQGAKK